MSISDEIMNAVYENDINHCIELIHEHNIKNVLNFVCIMDNLPMLMEIIDNFDPKLDDLYIISLQNLPQTQNIFDWLIENKKINMNKHMFIQTCKYIKSKSLLDRLYDEYKKNAQYLSEILTTLNMLLICSAKREILNCLNGCVH